MLFGRREARKTGRKAPWAAEGQMPDRAGSDRRPRPACRFAVKRQSLDEIQPQALLPFRNGARVVCRPINALPSLLPMPFYAIVGTNPSYVWEG